MQYDKKCSECNYKYVYIGFAQNGHMYYCKRCYHIELVTDKK